jgi:Flp pilus assembly pilin Flp
MSDETKKVEAQEELALPPDYKPLSPALRFFYGVGDFGFNIMNSVENYYFVFFLTNCAMLDPALAGIVSTVGSVIDAIVGWLWGAIGLQLGTGYTVAFIIYQLGTLITEGHLGVGFIPGLIAVLCMAAAVVLVGKRVRSHFDEEYALHQAVRQGAKA